MLAGSKGMKALSDRRKITSSVVCAVIGLINFLYIYSSEDANTGLYRYARPVAFVAICVSKYDDVGAITLIVGVVLGVLLEKAAVPNVTVGADLI